MFGLYHQQKMCLITEHSKEVIFSLLNVSWNVSCNARDKQCFWRGWWNVMWHWKDLTNIDSCHHQINRKINIWNYEWCFVSFLNVRGSLYETTIWSKNASIYIGDFVLVRTACKTIFQAVEMGLVNSDKIRKFHLSILVRLS